LTPFRPATLVVALCLAFAADLSIAATAPTSGLDKAGMDASVRPQDSLYGAMNGTWLKNTPIPADKPYNGVMLDLYNLSNERVKAIVEGLVAKPQAAGTNGAKIADFYRSYMDTAAIDAAGLKPIAPWLAQVDAVKNKKDLTLLMGQWMSFR